MWKNTDSFTQIFKSVYTMYFALHWFCVIWGHQNCGFIVIWFNLNCIFNIISSVYIYMVPSVYSMLSFDTHAGFNLHVGNALKCNVVNTLVFSDEAWKIQIKQKQIQQYKSVIKWLTDPEKFCDLAIDKEIVLFK